MNSFDLELHYDLGRACTLYSVRKNEDVKTEIDKFWEEFEPIVEFDSSVNALSDLIYRRIADELGAQEVFFRNERLAEALPPTFAKVKGFIFDYPKFPLRLFCMRLGIGIVILFGGGRKTSQTAQEGDTAKAFKEANLFASKIDKALSTGEIRLSVNGRKIVEVISGETDIIVI